MNEIILSILIPTLKSRSEMLKRLVEKLWASAGEWRDNVQILALCDEGERTTGDKRNALLTTSTGRYVAFVDDDDDVHEDYAKVVCGALEKDVYDCLGFKGRVTFADGYEADMIHSISIQDWDERNGVYLRPPNHLNPIKREHALAVSFLSVTVSEDHAFSLEMRKRRLLMSEIYVGHLYLYHYKCRENKKGL